MIFSLHHSYFWLLKCYSDWYCFRDLFYLQKVFVLHSTSFLASYCHNVTLGRGGVGDHGACFGQSWVLVVAPVCNRSEASCEALSFERSVWKRPWRCCCWNNTFSALSTVARPSLAPACSCGGRVYCATWFSNLDVVFLFELNHANILKSTIMLVDSAFLILGIIRRSVMISTSHRIGQFRPSHITASSFLIRAHHIPYEKKYHFCVIHHRCFYLDWIIAVFDSNFNIVLMSNFLRRIVGVSCARCFNDWLIDYLHVAVKSQALPFNQIHLNQQTIHLLLNSVLVSDFIVKLWSA